MNLYLHYQRIVQEDRFLKYRSKNPYQRATSAQLSELVLISNSPTLGGMSLLDVFGKAKPCLWMEKSGKSQNLEGFRLTLRGKSIYEFLQNLTGLYLPKIQNFSGLKSKQDPFLVLEDALFVSDEINALYLYFDGVGSLKISNRKLDADLLQGLRLPAFVAQR